MYQGSLAARWPAVLPPVRFLSLLSVGLLAGILVDFWAFTMPALGRLDASFFARMTQELDRDYLVPIPYLYILVNISATALALLLFSRGLSLGFWLSVLALAGCLALTASTVLVNVPINAEVLNTWNPNDPPSNWQQTRDRWDAAHTFRTGLAVVAFVLQLLSVLLPAPRSGADRREFSPS